MFIVHLFSPPQVSFLKRFGYLESGPSDSEALYTAEAVREAIQEVQRFGNIPQTGELDEETRFHCTYRNVGNEGFIVLFFW